MKDKSKDIGGITKAQENRIVGILWKRLFKWLFGGFSVLTVISVILLLNEVQKAYVKGTQSLEATLKENISKEFQTSKIKNTVEEVAKTEANEILRKQVNPEVEQFKSQTSEKVNKFGDYLAELKQRYENDYQILSKELDKLTKRNEIARLGDRGIVEASRDSLEELERIAEKSESEDIKAAAGAEIARIKIFWFSATRVKGEKISPAGIKSSDLKTDVLINDLLNDNDWRVRSLAVQELGNRKQKGVPEALLNSIEKDKNLEVVKDALQAFDRVTGFDSPDTFGRGIAQVWWNENSKRVNETLTEQK